MTPLGLFHFFPAARSGESRSSRIADVAPFQGQLNQAWPKSRVSESLWEDKQRSIHIATSSRDTAVSRKRGKSKSLIGAAEIQPQRLHNDAVSSAAAKQDPKKSAIESSKQKSEAPTQKAIHPPVAERPQVNSTAPVAVLQGSNPAQSTLADSPSPWRVASAPVLVAGVNQLAIISRSGVTSVAPSPLASSGEIEDPTAQTNVSRIARGLATALAQRGGSVTLRLTPPDLGTLRINLQINGARVSAGFQIESEAARTLLTQQIGQLRTSLENAGLSVERLSVQSMTSSSPSGLQHQGGQSATDGRSRGEYTSQHHGRGHEGSGDDRDTFEKVINELE